jgi:hypothetical protein
MSKRVAIYARVSTTRQGENDISIPDQLAQARKHREARGWYVVREFVDPDASARDDKRPRGYGGHPYAGSIIGTSGDLYGTALGGEKKCSQHEPRHCGIVFKLAK